MEQMNLAGQIKNIQLLVFETIPSLAFLKELLRQIMLKRNLKSFNLIDRKESLKTDSYMDNQNYKSFLITEMP